MTVHDAPVEREVKLDADPDLVVPDLDDLVAGAHSRDAATLELDAAYFDAGDLRLLHSGITVRRRTGEGTRWTVKLPTADDQRGTNADRAAPESTARSRREVDVHDDAERPPAEVVALLEPWLGDASLEPVARLVSHRRRTELHVTDAGGADRPVLEIDDDVVIVHGEHGPAGEFREIEIEQLDDGSSESTGELLALLAQRLVAAGARPAVAASKLERALTLLGRT